MSRKLVYQDADGEKVTLPKVQSVEDNLDFLYVEYKPSFCSTVKGTNIKKDRVIRYDE
jgi:hypothetical protein